MPQATGPQKKWFQVTQLAARPPPASSAGTRQLPPPSGVSEAPPAPPFDDAKLNAPKPGRWLLSNRDPRFRPAFRSPVATGSLRPPQQDHRSRPSPSANRWTSSTARPALAPPSARRLLFLAGFRSGSSRPAPLRCLPSLGFPCRTSFRSPPRVLRPLADQRFQKLNAVKACLQIGPISLRSPPGDLSI